MKTAEEYAQGFIKDELLARNGEVSLSRNAEAVLVRRFEHAIAAARADERRICAAYALDRADQYVTDSGCWSGLADAAHGIAKGEAAEADAHGEFDADLYARVDGFKGKAPAVRPTDEVGP